MELATILTTAVGSFIGSTLVFTLMKVNRRRAEKRWRDACEAKREIRRGDV